MTIQNGIGALVVTMILTAHALSDGALPPKISDKLAGELVLIPVGEFEMGSPESEEGSRPNERPRHTVMIDKPVYMGAHEVTVGQFRRFVGSTTYKTEAETNQQGGAGYDKNVGMFVRVPSKGLIRAKYPQRFTWMFPGFEQGDDHPVVNVSWVDANAYCTWLTEEDKEHVYRLPTEAEWEYACRAGSDTAFSWGDNPRSLIFTENIADRTLQQKLSKKERTYEFCTVWRDHNPFTSSVGSYKPNDFGLYDMHGNAKEWCQDIYVRILYPRSDDPPAASSERVLRGGAFSASPDRSRSARRDKFEESQTWCNIGFRVVREIKE